MNGWRYVWITLGAVLAAAVLLLMLTPAAKATNDPPVSGGTVYGDWTVTDSRSYSSVTITVQDGNLIVWQGASLTLNSVTLRLYNTNPSANIYTFGVQAGATLTVTRGTITSLTSNGHYKFIIKGTATIDGTSISEMWGSTTEWAGGVQIYTDVVSIKNCTISNGMTGGVSIFNASPVVAYNTITANGQDGQSTIYCYGLYAWNTRSNISSNTIYANNYQITISSYGYYYEYPGGWDYYSTYWYSLYGEYATYLWYYGYWGYAERYIESYSYGKAEVYGIGMVIQGGSDAVLYGNSIYKNGYIQPGSGGWYYNYYYEGSGYGYCPYLSDMGYPDDWNYCDFYVYEYGYSSYAYTNYGKGLIVDNSTVEIAGNTFDRNGFEPYHSYYADQDTACYYSGIDITMTNCQGNITGNTINNAAILVNLTNCRTNITGNKMLGDFIGTSPDPVADVSSSIIPWNAVWGIRANNTVISNILNNTLTIQYKSYPYFYLPNERGFASYVTAMDLGDVTVPLLFKNNKILVDDQYYGNCGVAAIRMELRSDLTFVDNTVEYRRANQYLTNTPNCYLLTAGNANRVEISNCAFKGPAGSGVSAVPATSKPTGPTVFGIQAYYSTALNFTNSSLSGCDIGIQALFACKVKVYNGVFTNNGAGIQAMYAPVTVVAQSSFTGAGFGLQAAYATKNELYNVSFKNCGYSVQVTDYSQAGLNSVTMSGSTICDLSVESNCRATVDYSSLSGAARGVQSIGSTVVVGNSTFSHSTEFTVDKESFVDVFNTPHTRGAVSILDNKSYFNVYWPVQMNVYWQDETPIEGAAVSIHTLTGERVFSGVTDRRGSPAPTLWLKEYTAHNLVITSYSPYRITASKGRASSMDMYVVDQSLTIAFHLIDQIPPELIVLSPYNGQLFNASMIKVRGLASDLEAGLLDGVVQLSIDTMAWTDVPVVDGSWEFLAPLPEGIHIIQVRAQDVVKNTIRVSLQIGVDTNAPVLYIFSPAEGSFTNQRTILVTGVSEEGAFVTVNGMNAPLSNRYFSTHISLDEGANAVTVAASDAYGNLRTVIVHVGLDTLAPVLEITSPLPGAHTNQEQISVIGTTEPTAVVTVNGMQAVLTGTTFEALVGLSEGANSVFVLAADPAGNLRVNSLIVILDTVVPDLTVFTPRDGLWTNQPRVIISGATEEGAFVTINGQNINVQNTVFSSYVGLVEGTNRIVLAAKDQAGNTRTVVRTVYLDTMPPELSVTSPADHIYTSSNVVPVTGSVDFGAEVTVNGERVTVTDFVFSTALRFASDGAQVIEVGARDLAGNTVLIARRVVVDTTRPLVTITYPVDNTKVRPRTIMVSGQTEPGATLVVNTATVVLVGSDGLFSVPVILEDGANRITVRAVDAAGNEATGAVTVVKPVAAGEAAADTSWLLNLTGVLVGIGVALPFATYLITDSNRRSRTRMLAEVEAAEAARKEREAAEARKAALPTVERVGKKRARVPAKEEPPATPPEPPKMEAPPAPETPAAPELSKAGLKDKSGAQEVSPDDTEQAAAISAPRATSGGESPVAPAPTSEGALKDKGTEAEGAAGETDIPESMQRP